MAPNRKKPRKPTPPEPPVFEFCVRGRAKSFQSKDKRRLQLWIQAVRDMALSVREGGLLLTTGEIDVSISEFSAFGGSDRDNMAKPILDAMQGIIYENDRQVRRLNVEWCDIDGSYNVRYMSPLLAGALCDGQEFIWIRIWFHQPRKDLIP